MAKRTFRNLAQKADSGANEPSSLPIPNLIEIRGSTRSESDDTNALIAKLMQLFNGYEQAHGEHRLAPNPDQSGKLNGQAQTIRFGATAKHYEDHLTGKGTSLGIIPLLADSTCWFGAIDVDIKGRAALHETLEHLEARIRKLEMPLVVCRSKSGGAHLYIFCSSPVSAELLQAKLSEMATVLGYKGCEIFPKQTKRKDGDIGNWINIAYYGSLSASGTNRYCIRNGKPIYSLSEFMAYAELMRMNIEELKEPRALHDKVKTNSAILDGERNIKVYSYARGLRSKGAEYEEILRKSLAYNEAHCEPPLERSEIQNVARSASKKEPDAQESDGPLLVYGRDSLSKRLDAADDILHQIPEEQLFLKEGGRLIHAIEAGNIQLDDGVERDSRSPVLLDVNPVYLLDLVSRSGRVRQVVGEGKLKPTDPKKADMEAFLERLRHSGRTKQRRLRMISSTPILLPDGTIICDPGYHEPSRSLIISRGISFQDPDANERLSASECRDLIRQHLSPPFRRFPFIQDNGKSDQAWDEGASFSVVVSGALSIALRNLLPVTPVHGISAPAQASGKTLLAQAICVLSTGTLPAAVPYKGVEEFAKHLPVLLMKGDRVVLVDNIAMIVNNADLAIAITHRGPISSRILGTSTTVEIENDAVFFFTGNNLQLSGEMPSRCLMATIMPDCEHPEHRAFSFDPVELAMELHPEAAMTMLRIARAHQRAGFEGQKEISDMPMRGFREYDQRVRALLRWLGMSDPMSTQSLISDDDPIRASHEEILWMLAEVFGPDKFKVCDLSNKLPQTSIEALMQVTGHKSGEPFNQYKVAQFFARYLKDRPYGDYRLVKTARMPNGKSEWRIKCKSKYPTNRSEDPI